VKIKYIASRSAISERDGQTNMTRCYKLSNVTLHIACRQWTRRVYWL